MNEKIPVFVTSLFLFSGLTFATGWERKQAPVMTEWGDNINPENVLPEYPRPQMERSEWMNLNGIWDFASGLSGDAYQANRSYDRKILVPFPVESALSGIMDKNHGNADKNYWYKRMFTLDDAYTGKDVLLHFGAVDWRAEVYVNGIKAGAHEGGYDPFTLNITDLLKAAGEQELTVRVYDAQWAGGFPHGKQSLNPNGIWYTPVTGIWQTVWIEPVSANHIDDFHIVPDVDNSRLNITVSASDVRPGTTALVRILDGETLLSETIVQTGSENSVAIASPKLWSPENPFLYNLEIVLKDGETVTDKVRSYFGMRKVRLGMNGDTPCIFLNNEPVFQYGVLDQGWWPDGLYTAPSDEAILFDLTKVKEFGFNMVRKHVKTEPARWYYHCDRLGLLVWQDIPNATTHTDRNGWVETNFVREMKNIMNALKNVPSITTWVVFNEGWGQYDRTDQLPSREPYTRKAVQEAAEFDRSRLIDGASGWFDYEIGDMIDKHIYPAPGMHPNPAGHRASVCGEYGGINLKIDNHIWAGSEVQYTTVKNSDELTERFNSYADIVRLMKQDGLCGAVYTQITDVESEINGLITYDRKVVKLDDAQTGKIRQKLTDCIRSGFTPVIPAGRQPGQSWKYALKGAANWYKESFDDSAWATGEGGFGTGGPANATVRTEWNTDKIYLRRKVYIGELSEKALQNLKLDLYYDEDCTVYIDGVAAASTYGSVANYVPVEIGSEARQAIRNNDYNLIAIQCLQRTGAQFIDAGLITEGEYRIPSSLGENRADRVPFRVYPNPANSYFSISYKGDISRLDLISPEGKPIKSYTSAQPFYSLEGVQKGFYLVRLTDAARQSLVCSLMRN